MKIGYLGPKGSFTSIASQRLAPTAEHLAYPTIISCLAGLEQDEVTQVVVPIENTIEGTVNGTIDYLFQSQGLGIKEEVVMPILQQLFINQEQNYELNQIKVVYSHPQALAQSQQFLHSQLPQAELKTVDSTALAAEIVGSKEPLFSAAIGHRDCQNEFKVKILAEDIQDLRYNKTSFWVIEKTSAKSEINLAETKQSICVVMPNNLPGALQKVLTAFSWRDINLSKIQSRPLKTVLGEYFFVIEIVRTPSNHSLIANSLAEIRLLGGIVKDLGSYASQEVR